MTNNKQIVMTTAIIAPTLISCLAFIAGGGNNAAEAGH